jgi:hypothetical protein
MSRLSISNACTQAAFSTFWEGTDNAGSTYWVEEGIHVGVHHNGTCGNGVQFYWADLRPGLGYNEHYPGGAVGFGVNYAFKILFDGGTTWESIGMETTSVSRITIPAAARLSQRVPKATRTPSR